MSGKGGFLSRWLSGLVRRVISWPRVIQEEDRASENVDPRLCPIRADIFIL